MTGLLAVIGAGFMGTGIARTAAEAGWRVLLHTRRTPVVDDPRINVVHDLDAVAGADIVVESIEEDADAKRALFASLDKICADGAVLGSNTSAIPITTLAEATTRPESVVGVHFSAPVHRMRLCELIRGSLTSDTTLGRARTFAESLGKTCVVVNRDVAGFLVARLLAVLVGEAARLVQDGIASAQDVDLVCELGLGHAMGPLRTADLAGLDIYLRTTAQIHAATGLDHFAVPHLAAELVRAGHLGRKSGRGFHT